MLNGDITDYARINQCVVESDPLVIAYTKHMGDIIAE